MRLREHVLGMIKETYAKYGFMQIETPMMEHGQNLTSKQGGDNEKLIFKVLKRGRDLEKAIAAGKHEYADNGMRYDLTVPLSRYYANDENSFLHLLKHFRSEACGEPIIRRRAASDSSLSATSTYSATTLTLQR